MRLQDINYEKYFWVIYFLGIISILITSFVEIIFLRVCVNMSFLFVMLTITGHFWARSDYYNLK